MKKKQVQYIFVDKNRKNFDNVDINQKLPKIGIFSLIILESKNSSKYTYEVFIIRDSQYSDILQTWPKLHDIKLAKCTLVPADSRYIPRT